ncbi:unnamed protein product [Camellia sinensis]
MGNANRREDLANGGPEDPFTGSNGELRFRPNYLPNSIPPPARLPSPDLMANSPPTSPARFRSRLMFAPQTPHSFSLSLSLKNRSGDEGFSGDSNGEIVTGVCVESILVSSNSLLIILVLSAPDPSSFLPSFSLRSLGIKRYSSMEQVTELREVLIQVKNSGTEVPPVTEFIKGLSRRS